MAKKSAGSKANFYGTYSCFPEPTENQGSNTNKGNVKASRNSSDVKSKGSYNPLVGTGEDSRAEVEFPKVPSLGQGSIVDGDKKRSNSSFGPGDASYKKGQK